MRLGSKGEAMPVADRDWVEYLVRARVQESIHLDFKRELPNKREESRKELLKDVAALANTEGGRIVYGVVEGDDACAEAVAPITSEDRDDAQRRIDQSVADGIEPRLAGARVTTIPFDEGYVLVVEVPAQYGGPFQTNFNNQRKFVYRQGTMNIEMNYVQLRDAFQLRGRAWQLANDWRASRMSQFSHSIRRRQLDHVAWLVLHVIPHQSLFNGQQLDLPSIASEHPRFLKSRDQFRSYTAEGLLYRDGQLGERPYMYARILRSGMFEIAWKGNKSSDASDLKILGHTSADTIRHFAASAATLLTDAGITGPAFIALNGVNIESHRLLYQGADFVQTTAEPWDSDMDLPMLEVPAIAQLAASPDEWCRPLSDMLYQTFGVERCSSYTPEGKWIERG